MVKIFHKVQAESYIFMQNLKTAVFRFGISKDAHFHVYVNLKNWRWKRWRGKLRYSRFPKNQKKPD